MKLTQLSQKIILLGGDIILLFLSLFLALWTRYRASFNIEIYKEHINLFALLFAGWIIVFYLFDLYAILKIKNKYFIIYTLLWAISVNIILSIIFFYALSFLTEKTPKTILLLIGLFSFLIIGFWRYFYSQYFLQFKKLTQRTAIAGINSQNKNLVAQIITSPQEDFKIIGFINTNEESFTSDIENFPPILGSWRDLKNIIKKHTIEKIVFSFDPKENEEAIKNIADAIGAGIKVMEMPIFYELATEKIPVEYINQLWFIHNLEEADKKTLEKIQYLIDGIISFIGIIITIILTPPIALAIFLTSPGPIFYRQVRVGKNEKKFYLYKFRTMIPDAESITGPVWAKDDDPRITQIGRFLRKTRLDELPQFYNVFRGELSIVGPRPERPEFVKKLKEKIPLYYKRHIVKPGMTGWAQINYRYGASIEDSLKKLEYDLYYLKNRSLFLYFKIFLRTIRIVAGFMGK